MYIIKNALRSIIRAKGRNILIFILVLIIAVSACIALSIKRSAESAKQSTYDSLSITAQIGIDRQKMMSEAGMDKDSMMNMMSQSLTIEELENYATSSYVDNFYYSSNISMNADDNFQTYQIENGGFDKGGPRMENSGDITVSGYSSHDAMTSFIEGENSIVDGQMFDAQTTENNCIISYELSTLNDLQTGNTITFSNPRNEEEKYTFTVSGIFQNEASDQYANEIFISYNALSKIIENSQANAQEYTDNRGQITTTGFNNNVQGTYVFSNVDRYNNFVLDVENLGLDTTKYTVTSMDLEMFEQSVIPLESLTKFTTIFFIVVLLIGGGILIIFNMFSVRERKYEIGVLTAIGMKKGKVALQFLSEVFIVTIIAIFVGSAIGAVSSQPIANTLLQDQINSQQQSMEHTQNNFGGNFQGQGRGKMGNMPQAIQMRGNVEYLDTLNTTMDITVIINLMGIALLLTVVASSVGMISVLRYEPLKILSNR